jgi:hypothetical protein
MWMPSASTILKWCPTVERNTRRGSADMKIQPTLILAGLAAGAVAAGISLAPNASAATELASCQNRGQETTVCQTPGNYEGQFAPTIEAPSQFEYPYGFLGAI